MSQTLDAVLAKGQTMPEKNRFPAVLQPIVIDRAALNQGENAKAIDDITAAHLNHQDTVGTLCARDFKGVGNQYVQEGKCIPCKAIRFRKSKRAASTTDDESWVEAGEANTLNNFDLGDTRTTHAVIEPGQIIPTLTNKMQGQSGWAPYNETSHILPVIHCSDVAPTVTSSGPAYSRTGNEQVEAKADPSTTIFSFDSLASNSMKSANPNSGCREVDLAKTIDTTNPCPSKNQGGLGILQTPPMAVRRLTPTECMRLQGFPDDWARIPWKGKPADQCPDGPQYKAAGNSMAVPVMRWIGSRIASVEQLSTHPTP